MISSICSRVGRGQGRSIFAKLSSHSRHRLAAEVAAERLEDHLAHRLALGGRPLAERGVQILGHVLHLDRAHPATVACKEHAARHAKSGGGAPEAA